MYIYIYLYVCVCICVFCIYIYIYVCICIYLSVCVGRRGVSTCLFRGSGMHPAQCIKHARIDVHTLEPCTVC